METTNCRRIARVASLAVLALVVCLPSRPANAQSNSQVPYRGSFTLPYEAQWGKALLPAGHYTLELGSTVNPAPVVIRDAATDVIVAQLLISTREHAGPGGSVLFVRTLGERHVIYSLQVADLGTTFISNTKMAREAEDQMRETQSLPIVAAKN